MSYRVILPKSAQKELDRLPDQISGRILVALADWKPGRARLAAKNFAVRMPGASASATIASSMKSTTRFCKSSW